MGELKELPFEIDEGHNRRKHLNRKYRDIIHNVLPINLNIYMVGQIPGNRIKKINIIVPLLLKCFELLVKKLLTNQKKKSERSPDMAFPVSSITQEK